MQTGSNYTAQDISGLRMQDNLKTNFTTYSSFMIYRMANNISNLDQNSIIFCIGENICRYAH